MSVMIAFVSLPDGNSAISSYRVAYLFPEYELITEAEGEPPKEPEKSEAEKMKEYREYLKAFQEKGSLLSSQDTSSDLDKMTAGMEIDKEFLKFKKRVDLEPA